MPDDSVARLFGGFRMVADRRRARRRRRPAILAAMGDWTGGFALFVRDGRLVFVLNRAGDEARVESEVAGPARPSRARVRVHARPRRARRRRCSTTTSWSRTRCSRCPRRWCSSTAAPCSCSGRDRGLPVCADYEPPFPWTGVLHELVIETGPAIEPSLAERHARVAPPRVTHGCPRFRGHAHPRGARRHGAIAGSSGTAPRRSSSAWSRSTATTAAASSPR